MSDYIGMSAQGWPINLTAQKVTIAINASASDVIPTQGKAIVGLVMPSSWTAASIQFYAAFSQVAPGADSTLLHPVKDLTTANYMQTIGAADDWIAFPLADALFAPFVQLRSVTAGGVTPVTQNAAREIILLLRNFLD